MPSSDADSAYEIMVPSKKRKRSYRGKMAAEGSAKSRPGVSDLLKLLLVADDAIGSFQSLSPVFTSPRFAVGAISYPAGGACPAGGYCCLGGNSKPPGVYRKSTCCYCSGTSFADVTKGGR